MLRASKKKINEEYVNSVCGLVGDIHKVGMLPWLFFNDAIVLVIIIVKCCFVFQYLT